MADPRALAAALRGDAPQLPENRMLGVADYAGVQPGYAPPGPMNAGPVHDFFANGGIAGLAGMTPAYQQIAENHAAADAAPDLKSKLHILADNPAAMAAGVDAPIRAYHGSPYSFDKFDLSKIGTGEGAQAYGHGLYFAGNEDVARTYRSINAPPGQGFGASQLANQAAGEAEKAGLTGDAARRYALDWLNAQSKPVQAMSPQHYYDAINNFDALRGGPGAHGHMYEVALHADPASLLDWDKPLSAHSDQAQATLSSLGFTPNPPGMAAGAVPRRGPIVLPEPTGAEIYRRLAGGDFGGKQVGAADTLNQAGIPGIQYLDAGSRTAGDGTRNYVMFDPSTIEILRKYGLGALTAGGGASLAGQADAAPNPLADALRAPPEQP